MANDRVIVAGLREGDPAAFDQAYEAHRTRVYSFLLRLARRRDLAEDLFQETWIALARGARELRADTDLAAWLFTVARNRHRSHLRWAMLDVSRWLIVDDGGAEDPIDAETPETLAEGARAARALERALAALPADYREVLALVGVEGMEQEQVAAILGIEYSALRKRLSRARAMLIETMERMEQPASAGRATPKGAPR